jgi:hypothetical protein
VTSVLTCASVPTAGPRLIECAPACEQDHAAVLAGLWAVSSSYYAGLGYLKAYAGNGHCRPRSRGSGDGYRPPMSRQKGRRQVSIGHAVIDPPPTGSPIAARRYAFHDSGARFRTPQSGLPSGRRQSAWPLSESMPWLFGTPGRGPSRRAR